MFWWRAEDLHYAEINFEGMEQLIDAVGGIDLNATEEVDDPEHLDIKIETGYQHMDGATALTYARCRYTYADGDYTRMRHQRQVLAALASKILNELDATTVMGIVEALSEVVMTTLSPKISSPLPTRCGAWTSKMTCTSPTSPRMPMIRPTLTV